MLKQRFVFQGLCEEPSFFIYNTKGTDLSVFFSKKRFGPAIASPKEYDLKGAHLSHGDSPPVSLQVIDDLILYDHIC